jgi:hypothetical protein
VTQKLSPDLALNLSALGPQVNSEPPFGVQVAERGQNEANYKSFKLSATRNLLLSDSPHLTFPAAPVFPST